MKPKCYDCKYRRDIPGDSHSECVHPKINDVDRILTPIMLFSGNQSSPAMKRLNVMGDATGIRHGWFSWPLNFDPAWLQTCDGFESKGEQNETKHDQRTESCC